MQKPKPTALFFLLFSVDSVFTDCSRSEDEPKDLEIVKVCKFERVTEGNFNLFLGGLMALWKKTNHNCVKLYKQYITVLVSTTLDDVIKANHSITASDA